MHRALSLFTCCSSGELQRERNPCLGLDRADNGTPCALVRLRTRSPDGRCILTSRVDLGTPKEAARSTQHAAYSRVALQASYSVNVAHDLASTAPTAVRHARSCACACSHRTVAAYS